MKKRITYLLILIALLLSSILASKWLPKSSFANDAQEIAIEAHLKKYINYKISENNKGTLIAYQINCTPIQNNEMELKVNAIDGLYPSHVKVINKENGIEQESEYNKQTGEIKTKNQNEYIVFCYYNTYNENENERELKLDITAKTTQEENIINEISKSFSVTVKENIGKLTSINYKTEEIYNGYMKSNQINGTSYDTNYKEKQEITISKKDAQEELTLVESSTFNENNLIYKSTKFKEENIKDILGEEGAIEIFDQNQEIIETINKDTKWEENGSKTINYENEPEELTIKTSKIQNEGILQLEHEKQIKAEISTIEQNQIKTTTNLVGIQEIEKTIEIQEAKTNINMNLNATNWTNKQQNEITFDIHLKANNSQDNMLKNPELKIELPSEVEKVIIQNSSIFHENGLELKQVYTQNNENGNTQIIANLEGEQTEYNQNELELTTDIKIIATVILKKDIENQETGINLIYTNQYTVDGQEETNNQETKIQLESYQEEKTTKTDYTAITEENKESTNGLKLEVLPVKGDTTIANGDTVYEGEYIKYNIKVTNTSNEPIENIKIIGSVPEGTTYGKLQTNYYTSRSEYYYKFDESVTEKEINIDKLEPGKSAENYYEVQVNNLPEGQEELDINTSIKAYVGEAEEVYETINKVKPAEAKVFLSNFLELVKDMWSYNVTIESNETKEGTLTFKLPKEYELDGIAKNGKLLNIDEVATINDNIVTMQVDTNNVYNFVGMVNRSKIEESKTELIASASLNLNNKTYQSNEARILFEHENVEITMSSENEGEEVKSGEEINYEIIVKNTGRTNIDDTNLFYIPVKVTDFIPENVEAISVTYDNWEIEQIEDEETGTIQATGKYSKKDFVTEDLEGLTITDEQGNELPEINLDLEIPYEESVTIKIKARAGIVEEKTKVENSATVTGEAIKAKTSNTITHIIIPNIETEPDEPDEPDIPDIPDNPDVPDNPDIPNEPDTPDTPNMPDNPEDNKYSIAGVTWLDENQDGERQNTEQTLGNIDVILLDAKNTNNIKEKTKTTESGTYHFSEIEKGDYLILFQYDNERYHVTQYQKSGATSKQMTLNGITSTVGIIEVSNLNADVSNKDIGFVENKIRDLKIDKYISKVNVTTKSGTKTYNYDNKKLAKVEIKAKEIEGATIAIEYKIAVTNEGETPETVGKIIDYLPEELTLSNTTKRKLVCS